MPVNDDFYIGYVKTTSQKQARWIQGVVLVLVLLVLGVGVTLVTSQKPFAAATFEFLNYRQFEGVVLADPYPRLLVERPGDKDGHTSFSSYGLVAPFKFGADKMVRDYVGKKVRLEGALIYRDNQTMMELKPESIQVSGAQTELTHLPAQALGRVTLQGEIIDSKCFMGVMKPGNLKPHRACAVRCISGGIPPILVVNAEAQDTRYFLLTDSRGQAVNKQVLDKIAVPVEISGELVRYGDVSVIRADPGSYKLL